MKTIELTKSHRGGGKSTTFSGRPEGKKVRQVLNIDKCDSDNEVYKVVVPEDTTTFNTSFFLGLFFESIEKLKNIDTFKKKYIIDFDNIEDEEVREILLEDIEDAYVRANNELNGVSGLDR